MHGYDVVDHDHISPELGGEDGLCRLVAALREHGMGMIVDIVPNHAAVGGHDNARWLEVLEWGDRKSVVAGKRVAVRVELGGRRVNKTENNNNRTNKQYRQQPRDQATHEFNLR